MGNSEGAKSEASAEAGWTFPRVSGNIRGPTKSKLTFLVDYFVKLKATE